MINIFEKGFTPPPNRTYVRATKSEGRKALA